MRLPLVAFSKVAAGEVSVNGGMTAVSSAGRVEQQQLRARGGGVGRQKQKHDTWNRQYQRQFAVQRQHNK